MTDREPVRLAPAAVAEPLIDGWAIWADLLSPVTRSLHLANYQCALLRSYLDDPQLHFETASNPEFLGAPFAHVAPERVAEIAARLADTERDQAACLDLARVFTAFYTDLVADAKGASLEPFYARTPEALRGYVELIYDYNCNPIIRPFESLLYRSPYYRQDLQSLRLLEQQTNTSREFFLSTPRMAEPDQIDWHVPFTAEALDALFACDRAPRPFGEIAELTGATNGQREALAALLTSAPPPNGEGEWRGPGVRVRYFNHACVLIQVNGVSIMTDPWVSSRSRQSDISHLSWDDLPARIDYAVITHGHHDHFVPETLLRLRRRIGCLVVPRTSGLFHADTNLKLAARQLGFAQVVEVDPLDSLPFDGGEIIAAPFLGEHADLGHGKSAYLVRAGQHQILLAADSDCLDPALYRHVRAAVGPVSTVFLGMECVGAPLSWLYGSLLPFRLSHDLDQARRTKACDADAAMRMLDELGAERAYVYALGSEPWLSYRMGLSDPEHSEQAQEADRFVSRCHARGFDAQRLFGRFEMTLD